MSLLDSIQVKFFPQKYGRPQVKAMLDELKSRPRPGDAAVHQKLDELNQATDVLAVDNLCDAYRQGMCQGYGGAEKLATREAVARRQTGFALQLARSASRDGEVSEAQKLAFSDIASQRYTAYGACAELPRLSYTESVDLLAFSYAPGPAVRSWMVEQGKKKEVDLPAARQLAQVLFADGQLSEQEKAFASNSRRVFGAPVRTEAQMFLRALGCSEAVQGNQEDGPSLLDEARSKDYSYPATPPWVSKHMDALQEAILFTRAHSSPG